MPRSPRPAHDGLGDAVGDHDVALAELDATVRSVDTTAELEDLDTCRLCQNHCQLTVSRFGDGTRHVSGNRCERGASTEKVPKKSQLPNLYDYKYRRIFGYRRLTEAARPSRGDIGIPRVLNMYENYPFWFTVLSRLGFRVILSGRTSADTLDRRGGVHPLGERLLPGQARARPPGEPA